jgi:hypothetical protein
LPTDSLVLMLGHVILAMAALMVLALLVAFKLYYDAYLVERAPAPPSPESSRRARPGRRLRNRLA